MTAREQDRSEGGDLVEKVLALTKSVPLIKLLPRGLGVTSFPPDVSTLCRIASITTKRFAFAILVVSSLREASKFSSEDGSTRELEPPLFARRVSTQRRKASVFCGSIASSRVGQLRA